MATYVLCPLSTFMQVLAGATNPATGTPLSGGLIWTYQAGTSTPTTTWTDSTGGTPNSNPIQLNTYGQLSNVNIYQLAGSKLKVQFSTNAGTVGSPVFGTQIGPTFDNVVGVGDTVFGQNTYYGGTDTGSANAYILTFSATFTSYTNGTIIYWVPSHGNTGASTVNVNSLGAINITNADGSALSQGQILANQVAVIAIQGGVAVLLSSGNTVSASIGAAAFTLGGVSGTVVANGAYYLAGPIVTVRLPQTNATSNSTSFSMASTNSAIFARGNNQWIVASALEDNGAGVYCTPALVQPQGSPIITAVQVTFYKGGSATGWTNTGTKGIGDGSGVGNDFIFSYKLS